MSEDDDFTSIAIIGLSCRFPGAQNADVFWNNIASGVESITPLSDQELLDAGVSLALLSDPRYVKVANYLDDVDKFDADFFGITPREAEYMSPQHRVFLECAWEALEHAGYGNPSRNANIGVFVGESLSNYSRFDLFSRTEPKNSAGYLQSLIGNDKDFLATYISYKLNLKGPSLGVQTACSTSLVSVSLACQYLLSYGADMALAGGITIRLPQKCGYLYEPGSIFSPDGHCRSFDVDSQGTVFGSGAGIVVLKRLEDARKDGDNILAVIRGSAINNDGSLKAGYTAPGLDGQADVISMALAMAGIPVESIGYVEAHGTGTPIGDPIEVAALTQAFRRSTDKKEFCALGSVKTNVGHLESAAGVASLIKMVYALRNKKLPPSLHFKQPNPEINFPAGPFYVNTELRSWESYGYPRRAGVSSFGIGGTNAHLILEEPPERQFRQTGEERSQHILALSAGSEKALTELAARYVDHLGSSPGISLADLCFTANSGRAHLDHRLAVVADSVEQLIGRLDDFVSGREVQGLVVGKDKTSTGTRVFFDTSEETASGDGENLILTLTPETDWPQLLSRLAVLYVQGADVDWSGFDKDRQCFRVELPTYPFRKERYWLKTGDLGYRRESETNSQTKGFSLIHPLIHRNVSPLKEQVFVTDLNEGVFYLRDHKFNNQSVLPGAACLEMARVAGEFSRQSPVKRIGEVVWIKPLILDRSSGSGSVPDGRQVRTRLSLHHGVTEYEIVGRGNPISRGKLYFETDSHQKSQTAKGLETSLDIGSLRKRLRRSMKGKECYARFQDKGFGYGPCFQTISQLNYNDSEALALLELPEMCRDGFKDFVLHPSVVDGAWQTVLGLTQRLAIDNPLLPFSLEEVEILRPLTDRCYAYVRSISSFHSDQKGYAFDILIADESGSVSVRMKNFYMRPLQQSSTAEVKPALSEGIENLFYQQRWVEKSIPPPGNTNHLASPLLIFDKDDRFCRAVQKRVEEQMPVILVKPGQCFVEPREVVSPQNLIYELSPGNRQDYEQLLDSLRKRDLFPGCILHICRQNRFSSNEETITDDLQKSFYAGLHLTQALMQQRPGQDIRFIYVHFCKPPEAPHPIYASLAAFAKSIFLENQMFIAKTVEMTYTASVPVRDALVQHLDLMMQEFQPELDMEKDVRYENGRRWVSRLQEADPPVPAHESNLRMSPPILREKGVYLITGGMGALGLTVAGYLAEKVQARLILVNRTDLRSDLTGNMKLRLKELEDSGAEVLFIKADVSKKDDVQRVLSHAKSRFHEVNGVIHAAGVIRDGFVLKKKEQEVREVLEAKIFGTVHLDEVFHDEPLDFFILFSSLVSVFGNIGQADYAFANHFMGSFALIREGLVSRKGRRGRTLSIHWPYWQEGGLRVEDEVKDRIREETGMHPLSREDGMHIFEQALRSQDNRVIAIRGEKEKIARYLLSLTSSEKKNEDATQQTDRVSDPEGDARLREKTEGYLRNMIHVETGIPIWKINALKPLEQYGIDSLMILNFNRALEKDFGPLSKVLFFEYQTLFDLGTYFIKNHAAQLPEILGISDGLIKLDLHRQDVDPAGPEKSLGVKSQRDAGAVIQKSMPTERYDEDIAIIGVGGQYPMATDLNEFWENLKHGKDCISEIPAGRWDYRLFWDQEKGKPGKAYSKWGGFVEDVDLFDPGFFKISPREAELMDPQERLFLKTAWETLEDAAYTRADVEQLTVGVFVGVMWGEYQLYGAENRFKETLKPSSSYASIANRISYFFDFQGPSIALDTMCSSSLTAMHLACESIKRKECHLALAGGVNVSVHPNKFIVLSQGRFASTDGRCRSFGKGGDGYVPGEGVGAVLLKPLSRAVADNDRIYGIIKATSINHGGKTNSYTVPNPVAQKDLIGGTLKKAGIDAGMISYIEAHGTGTSLGDPIEIASLAKSFREYTDENQFCAIGSVKSNIGHCESAAGIAGVTKVLLQLQHGLLVPSLHSRDGNPNIDFSDTPFVVQQELSEWKRPRVQMKGEIREIPRFAGISSFGAGGANAHVIIEEYIPEHIERPQIETDAQDPAIIVLSAMNEERLRDQVKRLLQFMEARQLSDSDLKDIAYTLQTGREAMEERLAVVVESIEESKEKLKGFLEGRKTIPDLYLGRVGENEELLADLTMDTDMEKVIGAWVDKGKYSRLLGLWSKGMAFDWHRLYRHVKPNRMQLPTYPFARERYWAPGNQETFSGNVATAAVDSFTPLSDRSCFLKKEWESCFPDPARKLNGTVAILLNRQTDTLARLLARHFPSVQLLDIDNDASWRSKSEQEWKSLAGCVDITGCGNQKSESFFWIEWLQQLIEKGHKNSPMFLCVTKGLESLENPSVNLSGAVRAGLYRMLQSEYRHLCSRHMDVEPAMDDSELARLIESEFGMQNDDSEVCYRKGKRYRAYLKQYIEFEKTDRAMPFPDDQVLLITGGTRGLGYLCARHFVETHGVKRLVLAGRKPIPPREEWNEHKLRKSVIAGKIKAIEALESQGAKVLAISISLTDEQELTKNLQKIKDTMGPVGGIIHCAGRIDTEDPAFIRKSLRGIKQVLAPKVHGLDNLYQVFRHEPLRFFILFSSISGTIPFLASGQSDYAAANAYMDYFAEAVAHDCPMVSIQWTNWKEAGMGEVKNPAYRQAGFQGMTDVEGLTLLDRVLRLKTGAVIMPAVVNLDLWKPGDLLRRAPGSQTPMADHVQENPVGNASGPSSTLADATRIWLASIVSRELRLDPSKLEMDRSFNDYGMDSVLLAQIVARMEKELGIDGIEPSALIENSTIKLFADYLIRKHAAVLELLPSIDHGPKEENIQHEEKPQSVSFARISSDTVQQGKDGIAVIGMACHFPDAENIGEYWNNLKSAKDSITEVPKSRWDIKRYYAPDNYKSGKSVSKWGAFLKGIEEFDPGYFHISEDLAPQIDPLQRQWLEVSAEAIADAGYDRDALWGKQVGVFAGARTGDFAFKFQPDRQVKDRAVGIGQNFITAHLAHIYNFTGPNMVVDTACSSSLTAIHLAVRSIRSGEAEIALAGGVDILLDESVFLGLSSSQILSPDGRSKPFDTEANGIGLGEGCGVLVLKPLEKAISDNDKIYAIIHGSSVNNDGSTMGITTPNPEAQKSLIEAALADAAISPETITYVETHGTGTLIGDPIELKALNRVFGEHSTKKRFCGVGSVKSNIGHLLSAAGAAGIIKVILSITHAQLPSSLHCSKPNPRFNFEQSTLYPVTALEDWTGENNILRAGISSFGLGGNNAHIILSNEGIPAHLKATLTPKGEKIVFHRKRFWPEQMERKRKSDIPSSTPDEGKMFLEFFDITRGNG